MILVIRTEITKVEKYFWLLLFYEILRIEKSYN